MRDNIKQTRFNFYTNILTFLANVILGIYYTPYLVDKLGNSAYGILPLALLINQYIHIITGALTSSFSRFYTIAVRKNNIDEGAKIISTSFVIIFTFIIISLPIILLFIHNIDTVFTIPNEYLVSAKYLFLFTAISFFFSVISSLFNVTLYAYNRLDILNVIKILRQLLKLLFVILIFEFIKVDVAYVGFSYFIIELIILCTSFIFYRRFRINGVKISIRFFDNALLRVISLMSFWTLIQLLGDAFIYRMDNFVVNKVWGIESSAILGAISEFCTYILIIVSVISTLFGPLILISFSKNDHEEIKKIVVNQSYIVGALTGIMAAVLAAYAEPVLRIWLNESFSEHSDWMVVKLAYVPFYAAGGVLALVYRTWNKVKAPAITTVVLGCVNILVIFIVINLCENVGVTSVVLIVSLVGIIQCYLVSSYFVSKIYKELASKLAYSAVNICLIMIASYLICHYLLSIIYISNVIELFVLVILSGFVLLLITFMMLFNKEQKSMILNLIK